MHRSDFISRGWVLTGLVAFLPGWLPGQQPGAADGGIEVSVVTERANALYQAGETVVFTIEVKDGSDGGRPLDYGNVRYSLSRDGFSVIESHSLALTGKPIQVEGSLDRPGFLRCEVTRIESGAGEKPVRAVAAAGVSPEEISPSRELPPDFEAFWAEQKERQASVPLEAELEQHVAPELQGANDADSIEVFDTRVRADGKWPVSGYFARPAKAAPKSLPAVLWTHGAGVRSASAGKAITGAREGFLSFDINAHGIANGQPDEYYRQLEQIGRLKDYRYQGRENRDGMYFRGMFLRLVRAIDFLVAQPEWDGQVVAVIGHSQGGAQALAAGGLDERVTFVGAGVPAMCDHTGMIRKRISGWPKLVPMLPEGRPDPVVAEVSRYFDAVNFSSRCHAETIMSVGFVDRVCPPTSCYAAFNQLPGRKHILNEPRMGHAAPAAIQEEFLEALKRHVAAVRRDAAGGE